MRYIRIIVAAIMLLVLSLSSLAETTQNDAALFKTSIMEYLLQEGFDLTLELDGDIRFQYQNGDYFLLVEEFSEGYHIAIWSMQNITGFDMNEVFDPLNKTVKSLKFLRSYVVENDVIFEVVLYLENLSEFKHIWPSAVVTVETGKERFIDYLIEYVTQ